MQMDAVSYYRKMGRGRGKGKKQSLTDTGSGEDEKLPVRRRGRPQKLLKDDTEGEDEIEKIEELDESNNNQSATENGTKRKRKENEDLVKDEIAKTNSTEAIKSIGYRQIGSRRKNKPRRAAEVGVECK
ncbi:hypothetical protein ACJIZ3_025802 [Penstemon smallii]|uniref:Uncharacterized protein n=1 Tax=Penstemon smallii TaxID=265156 RepID=A0ABD3TWY4_9LAMI